MKIHSGLLLGLAVALLGSCSVQISGCGIQGSGQRASQPRQVKSFNRVELRGATDVQIQVGSPQSVTVEADDNLIDIITTVVQDSTLIVEAKKAYFTRIGVNVKVTVPALESIKIAGSGDVQAEGIATKSIDLTVSGSGDITAAGTVTLTLTPIRVK